MPLNREDGEYLEGFGTMYRVVPTDKWAHTPLFFEAAEAATKKFKEAGGKFHHDGEVMKFTPQQVLCQEYPLLDHLVIMFCARIKGEEHYYWHKFHFPPEMISRMTAEGFWDVAAPRRVIH